MSESPKYRHDDPYATLSSKEALDAFNNADFSLHGDAEFEAGQTVDLNQTLYTGISNADDDSEVTSDPDATLDSVRRAFDAVRNTGFFVDGDGDANLEQTLDLTSPLGIVSKADGFQLNNEAGQFDGVADSPMEDTVDWDKETANQSPIDSAENDVGGTVDFDPSKTTSESSTGTVDFDPTKTTSDSGSATVDFRPNKTVDGASERTLDVDTNGTARDADRMTLDADTTAVPASDASRNPGSSSPGRVSQIWAGMVKTDATPTSGLRAEGQATDSVFDLVATRLVREEDPGSEVVPDYKLIRKVGEGAMGSSIQRGRKPSVVSSL